MTALVANRTLEGRNARKGELLAEGWMNNKMVERMLDKEGWPRPPGWESELFYPDSRVVRTRYIVLLLIIGGAIIYFLGR